MINTREYKNVTWIDLESPTQDEIRGLAAEYEIHPLAAEELLLPKRSKVDRYDGFTYLVLHLPGEKEIDFIIGKEYIVTARHGSIDPLHKFSKMFEVNSVLERNALIGEHPGYMFYYMMKEVYRALHDELEVVKDDLAEIEKAIFTGHEKQMVLAISNASRELLSFRHATSLHEEALKSFGEAAQASFGDEFVQYVDAMTNEYTRVEKTVQGLLDSVGELRQTNAALLETKQNRIMMALTIITVLSSLLLLLR
jgi:magnesium transporter